MKKEILFGLPVHRMRIDPKSYDKKTIIKTVKENYKKAKYRNKYYDNEESDMHHSFKDLKNKKFKNIDYKKVGLLNIYNDVYKNFTNHTLKKSKHFSYKYHIVNYTALQENQFMTSHQHLPSADFSAVHYIQLDEKKHVPTSFINTHDFGNYLEYMRKSFFECCDSKDLENSYMFPKFKLLVKEDDMIIFPSCLRHEIPKQNENTDKIRITISSNLTVN